MVSKTTDKIFKKLVSVSIHTTTSRMVINPDKLIETIESVISENVFHNFGDSEERMIADAEHLNCPHCGGSGHVGDVDNEN